MPPAPVLMRGLLLAVVFLTVCAISVVNLILIRKKMSSSSAVSSSWSNLDDCPRPVTVSLVGCDCARVVCSSAESSSSNSNSNSNNNNKATFKHTTCGEDAFARGPGQKVIAFTYFVAPNDTHKAGERKYLEGISRNAEAISRLHPDWIMRVYHNASHDVDICGLRCRWPHVDFCAVTHNPMLGDVNRKLVPTTWRFLAAADAHVDVASFRDLDSVVTEREAAAVAAWINSKHAVHVMRDHPGHDMTMLAGMWGVKVSLVRQSMLKTIRAMLTDDLSNPAMAGPSNDQFLLDKLVWPWAQDTALQHDSYTCQMFSKTSAWPTRRVDNSVNNFVGAPFALNATLSEDCPVKCRPREHKEWTKC